jgi:hypothetical protein
MSRYFTGRIGDTYLTSDGTAAGLPAKLDVSGDDQFVDDIGETITTAADGTLHSQAIDLDMAGRVFEIKILFCLPSAQSEPRNSFARHAGTSSTVRVQLVSVKCTIDVKPKRTANGWITTGKFSGSIINDVTLRLISLGPGVGA